MTSHSYYLIAPLPGSESGTCKVHINAGNPLDIRSYLRLSLQTLSQNLGGIDPIYADGYLAALENILNTMNELQSAADRISESNENEEEVAE